MEEMIQLANEIIPGDEPDKAQWLLAKSLLFTVNFSWSVLRASSSKIPWASLVWFKGSIPKNCFIAWLAHMDRLPTKVRISKYIPQLDTSCEFCSQNETRDYLFFACPNSNQIWKGV